MVKATPHCLRLLEQDALYDWALALLSAGRSKLARIAMMAMTTSSSINVKADARVARWRDPARAARFRVEYWFIRSGFKLSNCRQTHGHSPEPNCYNRSLRKSETFVNDAVKVTVSFCCWFAS